ncbi:unnamed protein product [Prunus armeniaca]
MKKVRPPPPAATCLAFHSRDGGIVAIGMDNSTIVTRKLEGHSKRVTSLAFSNTLNRSKLLQIPDGKELRSLSDTYIQIHQNEEEGRLPHPKVKAYQGLFEEPFGFLILHVRIKNKRHPKRDQATQ